MLRLAAVVVSLLVAAPLTAQTLDSAFFAGMQARSIGPAGMSGRVDAIEGVASDPNTIYVGAATGGLWMTTTGGVTWTPLTEHLPTASVGAIAVFQRSPDMVWIGTGEKGRRNSAGVGTGVYRSLDAGKTWTSVGLGGTVAISDIVLHPNDPNVAYVAALGNTWAESEERGVLKTTDGGRTWAKVLYVNPTTGAADPVMDPQNPNKLFVAMWQHRRWTWFFTSGGEGSGLYVTWDGGAALATRRVREPLLPSGAVRGRQPSASVDCWEQPSFEACQEQRRLFMELALRDTRAFLERVEAVPSTQRERWIGELSRFAAEAGSASSVAQRLRASDDPRARQMAPRSESQSQSFDGR